jgi:Flp pilus assembly pilin Flp
MKSIQKFFYRFIADERGLAAVEYAVVAGLIVIGLVTVFGTIGGNAELKLQELADALT